MKKYLIRAINEYNRYTLEADVTRDGETTTDCMTRNGWSGAEIIEITDSTHIEMHNGSETAHIIYGVLLSCLGDGNKIDIVIYRNGLHIIHDDCSRRNTINRLFRRGYRF